MRKYSYIAVGGMLGALSRFAIKNSHLISQYKSIPVATLFVNITGSFILAFFLTLAFKIKRIHVELRLGIATGFLGAYTTFSTLCKETVTFIRNGDYFWASGYSIGSAVLGLVAAYLGTILASATAIKPISDNGQHNETKDTNESEGE